MLSFSAVFKAQSRTIFEFRFLFVSKMKLLIVKKILILTVLSYTPNAFFFSFLRYFLAHPRHLKIFRGSIIFSWEDLFVHHLYNTFLNWKPRSERFPGQPSCIRLYNINNEQSRCFAVPSAFIDQRVRGVKGVPPPHSGRVYPEKWTSGRWNAIKPLIPLNRCGRPQSWLVDLAATPGMFALLH